MITMEIRNRIVKINRNNHLTITISNRLNINNHLMITKIIKIKIREVRVERKQTDNLRLVFYLILYKIKTNSGNSPTYNNSS
jgi:hypothetical protein